jgi:hypothetical protein
MGVFCPPPPPRIISQVTLAMTGTKQHAQRYFIALDPESQKEITISPLPDRHSARFRQYSD